MSQFTALEIIALILLSLILLNIVIKILKGIWTNGLGYYLGFGVKWRPGENVWAIVTGSTDGIGLEYAKQLAQKGYSILLISRNDQKLKNVAKLIKEKYAKCKKVKTLAVDFSRNDIYDKIAKEVDSLNDIDVLVNNVGILYKAPEYFTLIPSDFNEAYLNVNMLSCTKMIELVLPKMVRQKRGIIINLSSMAAIIPTPLLSVYCATKAYVDFLTRALQIEYSSKGIIIQAVLPGQVLTNMTKKMQMPLIVSVESYVSQAIKTVGIESRTYGHWNHKIQAFLMENIMKPLLGTKKISVFAKESINNIRSKYYKENNITDTFQQIDKKLD